MPLHEKQHQLFALSIDFTRECPWMYYTLNNLETNRHPAKVLSMYGAVFLGNDLLPRGTEAKVRVPNQTRRSNL